MRRILLATLFVAAVFSNRVFAAEPTESRSEQGSASHSEQSAKKIRDFSLRDFRGKQQSLADFEQSKVVVVAFIGCECPVAKLITPRLVSMHKEFGPRGVAFLAIDSNSQDSLAELAAFARQHSVEFPLLKDPGNVVADQFAAERTPEIFVLDRQRIVRYRGRVDDQYLVGKKRAHATRDDLKLAIGELLDDKPVSVPETPAVGCHIGRVPAVDAAAGVNAKVTYSDQIARLFQARCVACHRDGEIAPFPLTNYSEVAGWSETIREVVEQRRMPPWFADPKYGRFANDCRLSDEEKQTLFAWLEAGSPEGDSSHLPPPRQFAAGWQIDKPDQVVYIADEPVDVPAEGVVRYRHFTVDPGFKEDRWIKMAESRPDDRAVVHHMIATFVPPGAKPRVGVKGAMIGFAPGIPPVRCGDGMAIFVPAGSKILFQMHYTPNGTPHKDRSALGLVFADPATVKHRVDGGGAINVMFELEPGIDDFEVRATHKFGRQVELLSLMPHMHLRGKSFRYEAIYPNGTTEVLLDVPHYDFNWQLRYELAEPKTLPSGTQLVCVAHYDNSENNLANPDPRARVHWGEQTWDEMMIGYFGVVASDEPAVVKEPTKSRPALDDPASRQAAKEVLSRGLAALGGEERLAAKPVLTYKVKGTLNMGPASVPFDGEVSLEPTASRYRLAAGSFAFKIQLVVDGEHGWLKNNNNVGELPGDGVVEYGERMHSESVALIYPALGDREYRFALLKDALVGERAADGVLVKREGRRDVQLFFDPKSHLPIKTAYSITESARDILQETLLDDYVDVDGVQRPRKAIVSWDGTERATREMSDFRAAERPADEFAKPK
jgi:peroxiredoxin/mono/diheme cytochrome c family protein